MFTGAKSDSGLCYSGKVLQMAPHIRKVGKDIILVVCAQGPAVAAPGLLPGCVLSYVSRALYNNLNIMKRQF